MADANAASVVPARAGDAGTTLVETDVPARLDRLPGRRFHTLVVVALGITWMLDGLEVTMAGSIAARSRRARRCASPTAEVGLVASALLAGAVAGALVFGWLTDRFGRKRLFIVTLGLYLARDGGDRAFAGFLGFALFRVLTGAGIGGEYAAINSAIQELIPARYRGRTDLAINGSFWVGAALGAVGAVVLLQPGLLPPDWGWRVAFGIGAVLGLAILVLRRLMPESPRWLMLHGRVAEAERDLAGIERRIVQARRSSRRRGADPRIRMRAGRRYVDRRMSTLFRRYPRRAVLGSC